MSSLFERRISSPLGPLRLVASQDALVAVHLPPLEGTPSAPDKKPAEMREERDLPILDEAARQMDAYFARKLATFDLPLDLRGTDFQRKVWLALLEIPYGATRSYADLARAMGNPLASRAVGAANGRNPIAIIVPCHRVIGTDGKLTGYAGGLDAKRWLLAHERELFGARFEDLAARRGAESGC